MLTLELLGALSLRDETRPVPVAAQQKRPLGLLAILGLSGRKGLARDRVEAYLWPESSGARAHHALDQAVSRSEAKAPVGSACDPRPEREEGSRSRPGRGLPLAGKLWRAGTPRARSGRLRDPTGAWKRFDTLDSTRAPAQSRIGSASLLGVRESDSRRRVDRGGRPL